MNETQVFVFMLVLTRVSAFVGFFTLFAFRQIPSLVKVGLAVGLSIFWFGEISGAVEAMPTIKVGILDGGMWIIREFIIGVMLAVALNLFFMPCKIAGAYLGQELGLSLAAISNPGTPDSATLITRVLETFTVILFFILNIHYFLLLTIDYSFKQISTKIDVLNLPTEQLVTMLNDSCDYGLAIVAPVAVIFGIITVGLAILNRAAPSLNLFSVGMSIRTGFGIFCLVALLPVLLNGLVGYLVRVQGDIEQLLFALKNG